MCTRDASLVSITDLLVHLGRVSCSDEPRSDLTSTQWTCLRFFSRANTRTRTPSSFARFQATSRSTASQTIKSLEQRGLLIRREVLEDGRSVRLDLTPAGWEMVRFDPLEQLGDALEGMVPQERAALGLLLTRLSDAMARARGGPSFGHCRACAHFTARGERAYCTCMDRWLATEEVGQLCDRFRVATSATE